MRTVTTSRLVGARTALIAVAMAFALVPAAASAATITVTTTSDTVSNDGQCSLREAITASETKTRSGSAAGECTAGTGNDTIVLGPHTYTLSLTGPPDDNNATGDLDITAGAITIVGAGETATTINANKIDRVFDVTDTASLTLEKLTVTGGQAPTGDAAINGGAGAAGTSGTPTGGSSTGGLGGQGASGGGIRNAGTLVLDDVLVSGNTAGAGAPGGSAGQGGAGYSNPSGGGGAGGASTGGTGGAGGDGGGLSSDSGTVTIIDSTFTDNETGAGGAGGTAAGSGSGGNGGGNGGGGAGGNCIAGDGGSGGGGGGIAITGGTATISDSQIDQNVAADGGASGGCSSTGEGGNGAGSGGGGQGGLTIGGDGGDGGAGGGIVNSGASVTITDTTIDGNHSGNGPASISSGVGGHGGLGSGTSQGGPGNSFIAGIGGSGGSGGGIASFSGGSGNGTITVDRDTVADNVAGNGGAGGDGSKGGTGGAGGGGQGGSGSSDGGIGGEGGFGSGIDFGSGFTALDLTVTGNQGGTAGPGGPGGSGPGASYGGIGGEGGEGGIETFSGDGGLSHITAIDNLLGGAGAAGSPGTGSSPNNGLAGDVGTGADLAAQSSIEGPAISLSASIVGLCAGSIGDGGGNVTPPAATETCPGLAANPKLGPLANNGGPTETMALEPGSPAINLIKPPCGTSPDQRGVPRPQGAGCDAGAYEFAPPDVSTGAASAISGKAATLSATVSPNARATTWYIQYGRSTAYGSRTPLQTLAAGVGADAVHAPLSRLKPHTTFHYRIVATNTDGTSVGADATFKTSSFNGVGFGSRELTMSASGHVGVVLTCPKGAGTCKGTLTITSGKHGRLARGSFKITAGKRKTVRLTVASRDRKLLLGKKGLGITLTAAAHDTAGSRATTSAAAHLKRA